MRRAFPALALLLSACPSINELAQHPGMPGYISERESVFDGSREVMLEPAWLLDSRTMKLGLYWREPMGDGVLVLAATTEAHNFEPPSTLKFRIDGELIELQPARGSDFGVVGTKTFGAAGATLESSKAFLADRRFLERLLSAQRVVVRAELLDSYMEGRFSQEPAEAQEHQDMSAILAFTGFPRFYAKVWGDP